MYTIGHAVLSSINGCMIIDQLDLLPQYSLDGRSALARVVYVKARPLAT